MNFKKALVVDDNQDAVNILTTILNRAGYSVITAKDGLEAMHKIQREDLALVLLDIMMPEMDGFAVCEAVKRDPRLSHIPILMVSAKGDTASIERGLQAGAHDFIPKPIDVTETLRKIRSLAV
jgi:DNA-binding response OmpR family regulator